MPGRLETLPGVVPIKPKGLWKREQRMYLLHSLACQPNPDRERARKLLERNTQRTKTRKRGCKRGH